MLISKGDVYWVDMSKVWSELDIHAQKGMRPCVIVGNHKNNDNNSRVIIVPLTTKEDDLPQHTMILLHNVKNYVVPECITSIPKNLLGKNMAGLVRKHLSMLLKRLRFS